MSFRMNSGKAFKAVVSVATLILTGVSAVSAETRTSIALEHGWRFQQGAELSGAEQPAFDDSAWNTVDLPHTWNRIGNTGTERSSLSNAVQGPGWYRLHFKAPTQKGRSSWFLQFDGVGTVADVWLNGRYLGKHEGAFARFRFDVSRAIKTSGDNILIVKADNSRPKPGATTEHVIPLSGDFFMFGGIYRRVSLIATSSAHIDLLDFAGPGVYARVTDIKPTAATVHVSARAVNDGPVGEAVVVETRIEDANARIVARAVNRLPALTSTVTTIESTLSIAQPRLWQGVKDPYIYRTVISLRSTKGVLLDEVSQPLGLRTVRFDPDKGFFLNGEHLSLRGASMHQDRPVKGWAISDQDQKQDFDLLIDMGGNAVRLAHYQHDQYSYELADSRGIVAWAEIPLVNKVSFDGSAPSPALAANAKQQLIELIRQNYNHPSIAVWSVGNEVDNTPTQIKGPSKAADLLRSLNTLAKAEDAGRPTTFADCCEIGISPQVGATVANIAARDSLVGITDTVGYNRYFGWYYGAVTDFAAMLDQAHARFPTLPMCVAEYGAGAALTQHSDDATGGPINPKGRPHPEEFQNYYHEISWNALKDRPYIWAAFIWNMFDFASDSRREGDLTDINEKGMVSYDRTIPKDTYYFYRANWNAAPTLHLTGRRYNDRPYGVLDVKAYSNAAQAALSLNGKNLGATSCASGICTWQQVHLAPGENELRVTADIGGTHLTDSMRWTYSGSPSTVRIKTGDLTGYVSTDGARFGSDTFFSGGNPRTINPPEAPQENRLSIRADDPRLYDSFREGSFTYRVPVPNGRYRITLKFLEPSAGAPGQRILNVSLNGVPALRNFDVFAAAGDKLKAVDRQLEATATDGVLLIAFSGVKGDAIVSALAIAPLDAK